MKDYKSIIRRITPIEASRLQFGEGLDEYLAIDGAMTSDSSRYKAVGNSWHKASAEWVSSRAEIVLRESGIVSGGRSVNYATTCSGVECQSISVSDKAWTAKFFSEIEPFPCRVLAARYPGIPNLGDMTKIDGKAWDGKIDIFSGGTPCFAKGVSVLTKEGYKPIEDIKVGDEVLTHLGRFRKVLRVGSKLSNDLVEVGIVGREKMVCTAEHPFPLLGQHRRKSGEYYFDDPIVTPIKDGQGMFAMVVNANLESFGVKIPELPKVYARGMFDCVKVREVNRLPGKVDTVYNLEVEEDHTYIVNGIVTHNCQSISVAGKRHGMAEGSGTRSSLAFHWIRIARESGVPCVVWENVTGALSSNEGRDFAWFVHRINEAGYALAWRVLDGQWNFSYNAPRALPQRRKRIWLIAWKGDDWRHPVRVMFEREKYTGPVCPVRRTLEGEVIAAKGDENADSEWGLFGPPEPHFTADSRSDMISYSDMPPEGVALTGARVYQFLRECGEVRYFGDMFKDRENPSVDGFAPQMLENVGAGAGVAVGGKIALLTQAQWNAGLQMPWNVKIAPKAFDGSVSALSDVLQPWGDYLAPYVLSHRACAGILRRAEARGKKLDKILEDALQYQIAEWSCGSFDWVESVKAARKAGGLVECGEEESEDADNGVDCESPIQDTEEDSE